MAYSETTNYDLRKPATTDPVDISLLNWNADKIDTQMKANNNAAVQLASSSQAGRMSAADYKKINHIDIPNNADLNTYTTDGLFYRCDYDSRAATLTNCPTTVQFNMSVNNASAGTLIQTIIDQNLTIYRRVQYRSTGSWGAWHKWTNADESSTTFDSIRNTTNTTAANGSVRKIGKTVWMNVSATLTSALAASTWLTIGTLPADYRPVENFYTSGATSAGAMTRFYVGTGGIVQASCPSAQGAGAVVQCATTWFTS